MNERQTVVKFNDVGEFIGEVTRDAELVERRIVRVSQARRPTEGGAVHHLLVYAGALVEGQLIALTCFAGEDWGREMDDTKLAYRHADTVANRIRDACERAGLEVRPGAFEEQVL